MIYIAAFLLSTAFVYLGDSLRKKNRYLSAVILAFGVLLVAVLAGVRDLSIGTDIQTYGEWLFKGARGKNKLFEYIKYNKDIETLFLILVYGVSKVFSDSHWLYFTISLLQCGFTLAGICNYRDKISVSLGWLCFLLLFYGDTLNAMRQFIAIAISFWAFHFFENKQYFKYISWTLIAFLFHNTAVLSFLVAFVYFVIKRKDTLFIRIGIVVAAIVVKNFYSFALQLLMNVGILNSRFERYIQGGYGFEINPLVIRIPFVILILISSKRFADFCSNRYTKLGRQNSDFIIILLVLEMIAAEMRAVLPTLYRISFYFGYAKLIAYPRLIISAIPNNKRIYLILIVLFLFLLWIYQNVYQGNNDIFPYTSSILGIG